MAAGFVYEPQNFSAFSSQMRALKKLIDAEISTRTAGMGGASFGEQVPGFHTADLLHNQYKSSYDDVMSNLNAFSAALETLAKGADNVSQAYKDAANTDLIGAKQVDDAFTTGP